MYQGCARRYGPHAGGDARCGTTIRYAKVVRGGVSENGQRTITGVGNGWRENRVGNADRRLLRVCSARTCGRTARTVTANSEELLGRTERRHASASNACAQPCALAVTANRVMGEV